MDALDWMLDHISKMPIKGILTIKDHPQEELLRETGKQIMTDYNDIYREEGFEMIFTNDYSALIKDIYPF